MDLDDIRVEISLFLNKELYEMELIDYQLFFNVREALLKRIGDLDI